jgi:hypothetical protein
MNRRDYAGNPLQAAQNKPTLVIPPALAFTARKLLNTSWFPTVAPGASATQSSSNYAAAGQNVLEGTCNLVVTPYLLTSTEWHLFISDNVLRPIIFQLEEDLEILSWDKFIHRFAEYDEFTWGTRALYATSVGLPECVYGSAG